MLTLNEVLESKVYIKENSSITYGSPRAYIEPFIEKLDKLSGVSFEVSISDRVANRDAESNIVNEAFGRVMVQAKLPTEYCMNNHDHVLGLVYALDIQKPVLKVYTGFNAWTCLNISIFNADHVFQVDIVQGTKPVYEKALNYITAISEQAEGFKRMHTLMNEKYYEGEDINRILGKLIREGYKNKQIGVTPILSALKELEDNKSKYAIRDDKTSQWNIYNSITQYITDKVDIVDKANKSLAVANLFIQNV